MQIRILNFAFLKTQRPQLSTLMALICVVCFSLAQGASQLTNTKRITGLQLGESGEGSRVTVTGDSLLDDYEAFRRGDRFYVRIPSADFVAAQPRFQGPGFEDVQVQKVGDSVVISFRLHPGANARVIGSSNRLEVIFTSPNHFASDSGAAIRNRVTRGTAAERNSFTRSSPRTGSDTAGPVPPGSPDVNSDFSVHGEVPTTAVRSRAAGNGSRGKETSTTAPVPAATPLSATTPVAVGTPYPATSTYSSSYPPPTSTYNPTRTQPFTQTDEKINLESRSRAAVQWLSTNRKLSAGVGIAAVGLIGVVLFLLFRRRRDRRAAMAKAERVQPKYSPEDDPQEVVSPEHRNGPSMTGIARESWGENNSSDDFFFEDLTTNASTDVAYNKVEAPTLFNAPGEEPWEYVPESNPQAYKSKVQEEREVFEL